MSTQTHPSPSGGRHEVPAPVSLGQTLGGGATAVMGILNITPDSFSDGGLWFDNKRATRRGLEMADEGAFLVDVGGESTRPGAKRVTIEEEWRRIGTVIADLVARGVGVSVDTVHAEVARRAVLEGVVAINDVSGGTHEPEIVNVAADAAVAMVIQHWRGFPSDPDLDHVYDQIPDSVLVETGVQIERAFRLGLPGSAVIIDPGLGFAKTVEDSWRIADSLESFVDTGYPVLVGASRKRFVAARFPDNVERGTLGVTAAAVHAGAWAVRVHDVASNVRLIQELM